MFESAGRKFGEVESQFGLTVSIPKTKGLAMGAVCEGDGSPVDVGTRMVKNFTYLGSNLSSDCEATCEVKCKLARAYKAFGALRVPIFSNHYLSIITKGSVYIAVVISILLYGAETWTLKSPDVRILTTSTIAAFGPS